MDLSSSTGGTVDRQVFPGQDEENGNRGSESDDTTDQVGLYDSQYSESRPESKLFLGGHATGSESTRRTTEQLLGDVQLLERASSIRTRTKCRRSGSMPTPWVWRASSYQPQTRVWQKKARLALFVSAVGGAAVTLLLGVILSSTIDWNDTHHVRFDVYTSYVFWDSVEYNAFPVYRPVNVTAAMLQLDMWTHDPDAVVNGSSSSTSPHKLPQGHDNAFLQMLRPPSVGSVSVGGTVVSTMFVTGGLQALQAVALSSHMCCRNWAAEQVSEGRNLCRWMDLGVSVPVSMIMVACLCGQTDVTMLGATVVLVASAFLFWMVADEWVWILWSLRRLHRIDTDVNVHKGAVMEHASCIKRVMPNLAGWVPFCAAWALVWIRLVQLSNGATVDRPDHQLPPTTIPIVIVMFLGQCIVGGSQMIRHACASSANRSVVSDVAMTLAVVFIKLSMAGGAMAIARVVS
jgi:hypothetical protein